MYLYYDQNGVLKEIVNDEAIRQYDMGRFAFVYKEKWNADTQSIEEVAGKYVSGFNGVAHYVLNWFEQEGGRLVQKSTIDAVADDVGTDEDVVPFDRKRDLKFFKYGKHYQFKKIPLGDVIYSTSSLFDKSEDFALVIRDVTSASSTTLGKCVFKVDDSGILPNCEVSVAQFEYLLSRMDEAIDSVTATIRKATASASATPVEYDESADADVIVSFDTEQETASFAFTFDIPKGQPGQQGPAGQDGVDGQDGVSATIQVGTVTTGEPGGNATVENVGTETNAVFNFTIPQGPTGQDGKDGSIILGYNGIVTENPTHLTSYPIDSSLIINPTGEEVSAGNVLIDNIGNEYIVEQSLNWVRFLVNVSGPQGEAGPICLIVTETKTLSTATLSGFTINKNGSDCNRAPVVGEKGIAFVLWQNNKYAVTFEVENNAPGVYITTYPVNIISSILMNGNNGQDGASIYTCNTGINSTTSYVLLDYINLPYGKTGVNAGDVLVGNNGGVATVATGTTSGSARVDYNYNISGQPGADGTNALMSLSTISTSVVPQVDTTFTGLLVNTLNRTPVVGESFIGLINCTSNNTAYIVQHNVTSVSNDSFNTKLVYVSSLQPSVIPGGTTGQVLAKNSGTDYDLKWDTIDVGVTTIGNAKGAILLGSGLSINNNYLNTTGGGTTLNKYTYTARILGQTIDRLKNILSNAKGRVLIDEYNHHFTQMRPVYLNTSTYTGTYLQVRDESVNNTGITIIQCGLTRYGTSDVRVVDALSNYKIIIKPDGTVTATKITSNPFSDVSYSYTLTYYNDSEITT